MGYADVTQRGADGRAVTRRVYGNLKPIKGCSPIKYQLFPTDRKDHMLAFPRKALERIVVFHSTPRDKPSEVVLLVVLGEIKIDQVA